MTGYIIHYTDSSGSAGTRAASAGSTSTDITGLTDGDTYTISVEARSEHLSGESEEMTVTLRTSTNDNDICCIPSTHSATPRHPKKCGGCCRVYLSCSVLG